MTAFKNRRHFALLDIDPSIAFVERGNHFHLYFDTEDIAVTAEALKTRGVAFQRVRGQRRSGTHPVLRGAKAMSLGAHRRADETTSDR